MALLPAGNITATTATATVIAPVAISSISTDTMSASCPSTAIPRGMATAITIPTKPNTRPWRSGSTVSCNKVIDDVEKAGTASPIKKNRE